MEEPFSRPDGTNPYDLLKELNHVMSTYVGIYREEKDLLIAVEKLGELKQKVKSVGIKGVRAFNPGWHMCRDLKNMLIASEAIARSALARKESRGAHSRLDFESTDPEWGKVNNACSKKADGDMEVKQTPLPEMPEDLKKLFIKKEPAHA
jgi:succinate dehydrogenase / fumarate reductase flavoprotein subunit